MFSFLSPCLGLMDCVELKAFELNMESVPSVFFNGWNQLTQRNQPKLIWSQKMLHQIFTSNTFHFAFFLTKPEC